MLPRLPCSFTFRSGSRPPSQTEPKEKPRPDETWSDLARDTVASAQRPFERAWTELTRAPLGMAAHLSGLGMPTRSVFNERSTLANALLGSVELQPEPLLLFKMLNEYECGLPGRILAATFVGPESRVDADFSEAYGSDAWRAYEDAYHHLISIPDFIDRLDTDLLIETNRRVHQSDQHLVGCVKRTTASLLRGHPDQPGRLRTTPTLTGKDSYTSAERRNLLNAGVRLQAVFAPLEQRWIGSLQYPDPKVIPERLETIVRELKTRLAEEQPDVIAAAADFARALVALHPFEESNGRTARLLMNRILIHHGYAPAILARPDEDISLSPEDYRREVKEGIARTCAYATRHVRHNSRSYISMQGVAIQPSTSLGSIEVGGRDLHLGTDGFLYDIQGRPYLYLAEKLTPLAQLDHFFIGRRLGSMNEEDARDVLEELTSETQALFGLCYENPELGERVEVESTARARKADQRYRLDLPAPIAEQVVKLYDIDRLDPALCFDIEDQVGTPISSLLSKYAQLDLELWHVEQALKDPSPELEALRGQRKTWFERAKAELESRRRAQVSENAPDGISFRYEELMYEVSPLRFPTFEAAMKSGDDDSMVLWRGDYNWIGLAGIHPSNDPRVPAARERAALWAQKGITPSLVMDLAAHAESAANSSFIPLTTDLSLLTKYFASGGTTKRISLPLPEVLSQAALSLVPPDTVRPGTSLTERLMTPLSLFTQPAIAQLRRVVDIRASNHSDLVLSADRSAYQVRVPKENLLPGFCTAGRKLRYDNEQEAYGLSSIPSNAIRPIGQAFEVARAFYSRVRPNTETPTAR